MTNDRREILYARPADLAVPICPYDAGFYFVRSLMQAILLL